MVKGSLGSARTYLSALSRTLFNSGWPDHYLALLDSGSDLSDDPRINHLRTVMKKKNRPIIDNEDITHWLPELLNENKQNRMAFEYMMAWYLFRIQLDGLMQNIGRLNDFDYPEIPSLYEEAILLHTFKTGKRPDLYGRKISRRSHQRFKEFMDIVARHGRNKPAVLNELAQKQGKSYFYYCAHGKPGTSK